MGINLDSLEVLNSREVNFIYSLGEMILGFSKEELGPEFISEADAFIANLDPFLQDDLKLLFRLFDMRLTSFIFTGKPYKFSKKSVEDREKFYHRWTKSRIPLLRTGASALRALCGWSYYSLEKSWEEMNYPGKTLGREDKTPTLLEGKVPWTEGMEI